MRRELRLAYLPKGFRIFVPSFKSDRVRAPNTPDFIKPGFDSPFGNQCCFDGANAIGICIQPRAQAIKQSRVDESVVPLSNLFISEHDGPDFFPIERTLITEY